MIDSIKPNTRFNKKYIDFLSSQIAEKNGDIAVTTARIKTLSEYDPPADTTSALAKLADQESELEQLEQKYATGKRIYNYYALQQIESEKA